jgi:autotransporter-associated beta strand protein
MKYFELLPCRQARCGCHVREASLPSPSNGLKRWLAVWFLIGFLGQSTLHSAVFSYLGGNRIWTDSASWFFSSGFPNAFNDRVFITNSSGSNTQFIYLNSAAPITLGALDMANFGIFQGTGTGGLIFNFSLGDAELDTSTASGRAFIGTSVTINDRLISTVTTNMVLAGPVMIGGTAESLETLEKAGNGVLQIHGPLRLRSDGELRASTGTGALNIFSSSSLLEGAGLNAGVVVSSGSMNFGGHGARAIATQATPNTLTLTGPGTATSAGLAVGMGVQGVGIPSGTYITGISGTTLTLSNNITGFFPANSSISFGGPVSTASAAAAGGATSITLGSTSGLAAGMLVSGVNVAPGTRIASISASTITLDKALTGAGVAANDMLGFGGSTVAAPTVQTVTTPAGVGAGVNSITLSSTAGLAVGMRVVATGVPVGTFITSINGASNTVVLSANTTAAISGGSSLNFTGSGGTPPVATLTANASSGVTTLNVNATTGLSSGMIVTGLGIAPGTTISSLTATSVTLSLPISTSLGTTDSLSFGPASFTSFAETGAASAATTLTVFSVEGIVPGMQISGPNIAPGTTVTAVNPATRVVTLSAGLTGALSQNDSLTFGRGGGMHNFAPGVGAGTLNITGGTANFGTSTSAGNISIDIDRISVSGGTLNLRNGTYGGTTTLRAGTTGTLTLDGGTTNVYADTNAVGGVIFPASSKLVLNNSAIFSFAGPQDVDANLVSINAGVNTTIRALFGNATLSVGGDTANDVFNGTLNMTGAGANAFLVKVGTSDTLTLGGALDNPSSKVRVDDGTVILAKASTPAIHAIGSTLAIGNSDAGIETAQVANNYVGAGSKPKTNFTDQIFRGVTVDFLHSTGRLDLANSMEGFNVLTGNGLVTNTSAGTTGVLLLGENNPGTFTFTGRMQDGGGQLGFWKAGSNNINFSGANTFTTSSSASTASGSNTITMPSVVNVAVGQVITGTGIPSNTRITSINTSTRTVTLSQATNAVANAGTTYTVYSSSSTSTGTTAQGATTITLQSGAGLAAGLATGMRVHGLGIDAGTTISSIAGDTITLNRSTIAATTGVTAYSFSSANSYSYSGETIIGRAALVLQGQNGALSGATPIRVSTTGTLILDNRTATTPSFMTQAGTPTTTTTITMGSVTGLYPGMSITGTNINAGTSILSISGNVVTLSRAMSAVGTATTYTLGGRGEVVQSFVSPSVTAFSSGASTITVGSAAGITIGTLITGSGIQPGTVVTNVSGGILTLSRTTNGNSGGSYLFATQDRVNDLAGITLDKGGNLTVLRTATNTANGGEIFENLGTLKVQNGFSLIRTQHSDGSGSINGVIQNLGITLRFGDYTRQAGGVVAFTTETTNDANTGFVVAKTGTTPDLTGSRIAFAPALGALSLLVGDAETTEVDTRVLIGAYGGTTNGAVDRLVTVETFGGLNYVRMLDVGQTGDYRTNITSATPATITASNLAGAGTSQRDDNLRLIMGSSGSQLIKIDPSANALAGRLSFNAMLVNANDNTLRIAEQNTLHLGGYAGDSLHTGVTGSGMMLNLNNTFRMHGGTFDFGSREAIIRANGIILISSEISGSGGLTKSGGNPLTLQGWNAYSGLTTVTQGELIGTTSQAFGVNGTANGVVATNGSIRLADGANIGSFNLGSGGAKPLTLNVGGNLLVTDQASFWNGQVRVNPGFETGQGGNTTLQVDGNAIMVLNGGVSGISTALGGVAINPTYTSNQEGRQIIFTNGGSGANRNGAVRINGLNSAGRGLSDEDFGSALANHQKLNLVIRGYTGQSSVTNSNFNLIIEDSSSTNGFLDLRSGYTYLLNGWGSADQNTISVVLAEQAFFGDLTITVRSSTGLQVGQVLDGPGLDVGTTVAAIDGNVITLSAALTEDVPQDSTLSSSAGGQGVLIRQHDGGNVDRSGTISAIFLDEAGASFRAPTLSYGENNGNYSSGTTGILGGINNVGTVTFGNGQNTYDLNPLNGNYNQGKTVSTLAAAGATTLVLNNAQHLAVGQRITGTGIAPGTNITGISGSTVTLSSPTTANIAANAGVTLGIGVTASNSAASAVGPRGTSTNTSALASGATTIPMSSVLGLRPGMIITGPGIPANTTITNVSGSNIDINNPTNSAIVLGNTYTFANPNGSQYLSLTSTTGLAVGMGVTGPGIQADTVIANINSTNNVITLSRTLTAAVAQSNSYSFFNPGNQLTLTSVAGLEVGMGLTGTGIPAGTTITAINTATGTITLSTQTNSLVDLNTLLAIPLPVVSANVSTAATSGATQLVLSSTAGVFVGSTIQGTGIVDGTTITAVNTATNTITLSAAINANIGANGTVNVRKLANYAETRLYQREGGTADFKIRFTEDGGFALSNEIGALSKVGKGTVVLSGSAVGGASDLDGGINVFAGRLELDYGTNTNNSRVNGGNTNSPYQLTLGGGELRLTNSGTVNPTENFRGNFSLRPGGSAITTTPAFSSAINLFLGRNNPLSGTLTDPYDAFTTFGNPSFYWREPDRYSGAAVLFNYQDTNGIGRIYYSQSNLDPIISGSGQLGLNTVIPYAAVRYFDAGANKTVVDFASFDADVFGGSANLLVLPLTMGAANFYIDLTPNVSNWKEPVSSPDGVVNGVIADETPSAFNGNAGFSGTLAANNDPSYATNPNDFIGAKVIRFMADTVSNLNTINLGGKRLVMGSGFVNNTSASYQGYAATRDGGAILVSNLVGSDDQLISNGILTSAYKSISFSRATMVAPEDRRVHAYDSRDLVLNNYNMGGLLRISATVADYVVSSDVKNPDGTTDTTPGTLNLVIAGPGTTRLETNNSYTGTTYIGGGLQPHNGNTFQPGTLLINNQLRLGPTPGSVKSNSIYLNGGRIEFADEENRSGASLGTITLSANRGILLGGSGGHIRTTHAGTILTYGGIIQSEANILPATTASMQMAVNPGVGDLVKEGDGRLILTNSTPVGTAGWNAYHGLTEVRGGVLQVSINTASSGILGGGTTIIDGTLVDAGARLDFEITGGSTNGTSEWITLAGGTLGTTSSHADGTLDGVITVSSNSSIDVVGSGTLRLNASAGYLNGEGTLTKTGAGTLMLFENNGDLSADWVINGGNVIGVSQGLPLGTGSSLALGDNGAIGPATSAALYLRARAGYSTQYTVSQNITVRAESSGVQTKELGVSNLSTQGSNGDRYLFNGSLTLNDDLSLAYRDERGNARLVENSANPEGLQQAGRFRFLALNGPVSGSGNIRVNTVLSGAGAESVIAYYELNADNTPWTGGIEMGNAAAATHQATVLRLGSNNALRSGNTVTMNFDNTLQVGGNSVTMGSLFVTPGGIPLSTGALSSGIIVENAANSPGTLTITQTSDEVWDVLFRDGATPAQHTASTAPVYGNLLNLVKAGDATATLTQTNTYTGTTTITDGTLRSGENNVLPDVSAIFVTPSGAGDTATLDLNGRNDTVHSLTLGGAVNAVAVVQTGVGTATLNGNVTYNATNNPGGGMISGNLALGAATRTFTVGNSANAGADLTVSAVISGTGVGVIKEGAGLLALSADNTYNGTTTVNAGGLQLVSGDTGAVGSGVTTIAATATLSGTGTVSGTVGSSAHVLNGILTPGDITVSGARGTLTIQGNLMAAASTSQMLFDLFSPTGTYGGSSGDLQVGSSNYATTLNSLASSFGTSLAGDLDHLIGTGGTLTLSGTTSITVNAVSGGTPFAVGQVFNLLDWATINPTSGTTFDLGGNQRGGGALGDLSLPTLAGLLAWDTTKFFSDGMLVIVQVPEPGKSVLLLFGLISLVCKRRRPAAP